MGRVGRAVRGLVLSGAGAALLALLWLGFVWPPPSWWRTHWPTETAFMRMRARQLAAARDTTPRRYVTVPQDSISEWLAKAATTGEDDAFYTHHGIDYHALREALGYRRAAFSWSDRRDRAELMRAIGRARERRDRLRGASTITQQLAKNLYLSPSRNPLRKLKEAVIAYRLEWALSKARIMALYLNVAEFGPNLWGVEAASRRYFGRGAAVLSMDQSALLVATLPHPLTSNPSYRAGRTWARQQLILRKMRGEPVEVPAEAAEDTVPATLPPVPDKTAPLDSTLRDTTLGRDSTARRDTTAPRDTTRRDSLPRRDTTRRDSLPRRDSTVRRDTLPRPHEHSGRRAPRTRRPLVQLASPIPTPLHPTPPP